MQFDRNRIVIRERGWLDVLDLALRVSRVYAGPLLLALAVGIVPAMLLNAWLLSGMAETEFDERPRLVFVVHVVFGDLRNPAGDRVATLYLGEAVFEERPRARSLTVGFFACAAAVVRLSGLAAGGADSVGGHLVRAVRRLAVPQRGDPLGAQPAAAGRRGQMTTFRRSTALHGGSIGDLFARWLGSVGLGGLLFAAFWLTMQSLAGLLLSEWKWQGLTYTLYFPLALWMVVGYFTVARFLGYLDLRIRNEGWEVELMMRAEADRMSRQLT